MKRILIGIGVAVLLAVAGVAVYVLDILHVLQRMS